MPRGVSGSRVKIMKEVIQNVVMRSAQLGLILVCMTCLTSCSMITGLAGFLIALPFRLMNAIIP